MMKQSIVLLMADDDEEDCRLSVWHSTRQGSPVKCVLSETDESFDYLLHEGMYVNPENAPLPDLILLDLNMPRKNGREALKEIRSIPQLKDLPISISPR